MNQVKSGSADCSASRIAQIQSGESLRACLKLCLKCLKMFLILKKPVYRKNKYLFGKKKLKAFLKV
jgi:hypothetical protein